LTLILLLPWFFRRKLHYRTIAHTVARSFEQMSARIDIELGKRDKPKKCQGCSRVALSPRSVLLAVRMAIFGVALAPLCGGPF
jgi:hypothetical protein